MRVTVLAMRTSALLALAAALLVGCAATPEPQASGQASPEPQVSASETPARTPVAAPAAAAEPPKGANPGAKLTWASNEAAGRSIAAKQGKYVVLKFEADWCGPCQLMKKEAFNDEEVVAAMKDAVIVPVDIDKPENMELQRKHRVDSIPALVFTEASGKPFATILGYDSVAMFRDQLASALAKR
jgi:thiol:disulfide interchange protein